MPYERGPKPSLRSKWLGAKLREIRRQKRVSLKQAGEFLQREASTIGRYEAGEFPLRRTDLLALMSFYDVKDQQMQDELLELCNGAWNKSWWDRHRDELGNEFFNVPWLENHATEIKVYEQQLIHGLLQTPDYAAAVIRATSSSEATGEQIKRWTDLRIDRSAALTNHQLLPSFILDEATLSRPSGSNETMKLQLKHLLDLGDRSEIKIRVLETKIGPHQAIRGSFVLYKMPRPYPDLAYTETLDDARYISAPDLERYENAWEAIDKLALSKEASTDLIASYLKEYQ